MCGDIICRTYGFDGAKIRFYFHTTKQQHNKLRLFKKETQKESHPDADGS